MTSSKLPGCWTPFTKARLVKCKAGGTQLAPTSSNGVAVSCTLHRRGAWLVLSIEGVGQECPERKVGVTDTGTELGN